VSGAQRSFLENPRERIIGKPKCAMKVKEWELFFSQKKEGAPLTDLDNLFERFEYEHICWRLGSRSLVSVIGKPK
jgi:hypothetical protein